MLRGFLVYEDICTMVIEAKEICPLVDECKGQGQCFHWKKEIVHEDKEVHEVYVIRIFRQCHKREPFGQMTKGEL